MKQISFYALYSCKATAVSAGDTEPQNAVLLLDTRFEDDNLSVAFDCCVDDFNALEDITRCDTVSCDQEDIDTVIISGKPISDYCF